MNAKPAFDQPRPSQTIAVAALATVIGMCLLWAVAALFQSRGQPFERLVAAEQACAQYAYRSEQQACIDSWIAQHAEHRLAKQ